MLEYEALTKRGQESFLRDIFAVAVSVPDSSHYFEHGLARPPHPDSFVYHLTQSHMGPDMGLTLDQSGTLLVDNNSRFSTPRIVKSEFVSGMLFWIERGQANTKEQHLNRIAHLYQLHQGWCVQNTDFLAHLAYCRHTANTLRGLWHRLGTVPKMRITFDTEPQC